MKLSPRSTQGAAAFGTLAAGAMAADARADDEQEQKLRKLIEPLPSDDHKKVEQILEEILKGGSDAVAKLTVMTGQEFGIPEGVKPKYALHGLVHHVCRPKADAPRGLVAQTLAEQLDNDDHSDELKAFVCRQLQFCGRDDEIPALGALLTSDRLCEPATQAISAIGGDKAAAALRGALPEATGGRRMTLVNALGRLGDKAAAPEIRKDANAEDADLRMVARFALGNVGDGDSADVLLKAAVGKPSYERDQATDACLRLARGLAEQGKAGDAAEICRKLMDMRQAEDEVHERCAALACLAEALGVKALDDVNAALESKDLWLKNATARTAVDVARAIAKDDAAEAKQLLQKILGSTKEGAVHEEVHVLLLDLEG
jgi:nucleotide-binding universal stress UspA family protein